MPKTRSRQGGQAKAIPELLHQTPFMPEPRVAAVGMYSSCDKPAVMDTVLTCRAYANTCCACVFLIVVRCPEKSLPYTEPDQGTNDQVQAESTDFWNVLDSLKKALQRIDPIQDSLFRARAPILLKTQVESG